MCKVFLSKNADKSVEKIPKEYQIQLVKIIKKLTQDPFALDIKKLNAGHKVTHRLRMGSCRVFLTINVTTKEIIIYDVVCRTTQTYK